jgi:two-component system chemotaxis response regulator CheB
MERQNQAIIRVAVVEDTTALGKVIRRVVESMTGVECVGVWENAEDALKQIPRLKPDVVLMDIVLPGMTGIEPPAIS